MTDVDVELQKLLAEREITRLLFAYDPTAGDFPLQAITAGRYDDTFEVVDAEWRFRSRQIHADLSGDLSRHMKVLPGDYRIMVEQPRHDSSGPVS